MDLGLRDRVYIVTGGSRGLGRAAAQALLAEGARVVLSARGAEAVDAAARELGETAGGADQVVGVVADNADPDTAHRLLDTALTAFGRVDGALVSVGGPPPGPVADTPDEVWLDAFGGVFLGALRIARMVGSALAAREGEGSIAFVLSTSVRQPIPGLGVSNGLRPGLAGAAKALADELGPSGVRVNGLLPGSIATDRLRSLAAARGEDPEEALARTARGVPLRRVGTPEEFGRVAAFVLSPAASYLTGAQIPVDGGVIRGI
ncbi:SDR family oxidoreductase [Allonocardiopsis opalescens]|uniref:3-oxoacyl-[acyl-carrier protein] reductase n=1 Tax=Allonocardiopsis opalescens TaxID=1144618 RepID=A0A2T0Q4B6_9ACTN|nr:SDR family oxidoreductase [Allonocardiopsis opalescens]PRX98603.1 3-oxoacyl-[acyl-carrier protein] reductase [Allonocardiopsis opalescens]